MSTSNIEICMKALEKVTGESKLVPIALLAGHTNIRMKALGRVKDMQRIEHIAATSNHADTRLAALEKITDFAQLADIILTTKHADVEAAAIDKIINIGLLQQLKQKINDIQSTSLIEEALKRKLASIDARLKVLGHTDSAPAAPAAAPLEGATNTTVGEARTDGAEAGADLGLGMPASPAPETEDAARRAELDPIIKATELTPEMATQLAGLTDSSLRTVARETACEAIGLEALAKMREPVSLHNLYISVTNESVADAVFAKLLNASNQTGVLRALADANGDRFRRGLTKIDDTRVLQEVNDLLGVESSREYVGITREEKKQLIEDRAKEIITAKREAAEADEVNAWFEGVDRQLQEGSERYDAIRKGYGFSEAFGDALDALIALDKYTILRNTNKDDLLATDKSTGIYSVDSYRQNHKKVDDYVALQAKFLDELQASMEDWKKERPISEGTEAQAHAAVGVGEGMHGDAEAEQRSYLSKDDVVAATSLTPEVQQRIDELDEDILSDVPKWSMCLPVALAALDRITLPRLVADICSHAQLDEVAYAAMQMLLDMKDQSQLANALNDANLPRFMSFLGTISDVGVLETVINQINTEDTNIPLESRSAYKDALSARIEELQKSERSDTEIEEITQAEELTDEISSNLKKYDIYHLATIATSCASADVGSAAVGAICEKYPEASDTDPNAQLEAILGSIAEKAWLDEIAFDALRRMSSETRVFAVSLRAMSEQVKVFAKSKIEAIHLRDGQVSIDGDEQLQPPTIAASAPVGDLTQGALEHANEFLGGRSPIDALKGLGKRLADGAKDEAVRHINFVPPDAFRDSVLPEVKPNGAETAAKTTVGEKKNDGAEAPEKVPTQDEVNEWHQKMNTEIDETNRKIDALVDEAGSLKFIVDTTKLELTAYRATKKFWPLITILEAKTYSVGEYVKHHKEVETYLTLLKRQLDDLMRIYEKQKGAKVTLTPEQWKSGIAPEGYIRITEALNEVKQAWKETQQDAFEMRTLYEDGYLSESEEKVIKEHNILVNRASRIGLTDDELVRLVELSTPVNGYLRKVAQQLRTPVNPHAAENTHAEFGSEAKTLVTGCISASAYTEQIADNLDMMNDASLSEVAQKAISEEVALQALGRMTAKSPLLSKLITLSVHESVRERAVNGMLDTLDDASLSQVATDSPSEVVALQALRRMASDLELLEHVEQASKYQSVKAGATEKIKHANQHAEAVGDDDEGKEEVLPKFLKTGLEVPPPEAPSLNPDLAKVIGATSCASEVIKQLDAWKAEAPLGMVFLKLTAIKGANEEVALAAFDRLKSDPHILADIAMETRHASVGIQALKIACNQLGGGTATSVYLKTKLDAVADAALQVLVESGVINNFNFSICENRNRFVRALAAIHVTHKLQYALEQLNPNRPDYYASPEFTVQNKMELIKNRIAELSSHEDDGPAGVSSADANPGGRTLQ